MQLLTNLWRDDLAQDTSEYALLLLLITAALVTTVGLLGTNINTIMTKVKDALVPK